MSSSAGDHLICSLPPLPASGREKMHVWKLAVVHTALSSWSYADCLEKKKGEERKRRVQGAGESQARKTGEKWDGFVPKTRYYDDGDIENMMDRQERKANRQRQAQRKRQRHRREGEGRQRTRINLGGIYWKHNLLNGEKIERERELNKQWQETGKE